MPPLKLGIWVHLSFWIFFVLVYGLIFSTLFPLDVTLQRTFVNAFPLALLFYGHSPLIDRFWERRRWAFYFLATAMLFAIITWMRIQLNLGLPSLEGRFAVLPEEEAITAGAIATNLGMLLFSGLFRLLQHRSERERKAQATINEQQAAQLQFLKAQINPHFLFNTLHNIYALAVVRSPQTADMVLQLSSLLRYVIYESKEGRVRLHSEIEQIHRYVDLFRMRSEGQLDIRFDIPSIPPNIEVEPMVLLPLVENCFKHCDFESNPDAFVALECQLENGQLTFFTRNTVNLRNEQKDPVGGVGLENIRKRLNLQFGNRYQLDTRQLESLYEVNLQMPYFEHHS